MGTTLAMILLVVGAQAVLADTDTSATNSSLSEVRGVITTIDKTATPITVTITPKEGSTVIVKVDTTTVITKTGTGSITLNDLAVNDQASTTYNKDTNIAVKINIIQPIKRHAFEGTIKNIASPVIVVTTKKGDETFQVNTNTQYKVPGVKDATLGNFKAGDKVGVLTVEPSATTGNAMQTAQRLTLIPARPIKTVHTGTVTAYTANISITIQDKKGDSVTFLINSTTKINLRKGLAAIAIGDRIVVTGEREPSNTQFTAKRIIDAGVTVTPAAKTTNNSQNSNKTEKNNPNVQAKNNLTGSVKNNIAQNKNR